MCDYHGALVAVATRLELFCSRRTLDILEVASTQLFTNLFLARSGRIRIASINDRIVYEQWRMQQPWAKEATRQEAAGSEECGDGH